MSPERLPDDELDRLLREALPDELPRALEDELRSSTRAAWRRAKAASSRSGSWNLVLARVAWRTLLPQPALVAASVLMLAAGAAMQAAPVPREVVAALEGRRAWALTAMALQRAAEMDCTVAVVGADGQARRHRIVWTRDGVARVRLDDGDGAVEHVLRTAGAGASVLFPAAPRAAAIPSWRRCATPCRRSHWAACWPASRGSGASRPLRAGRSSRSAHARARARSASRSTTARTFRFVSQVAPGTGASWRRRAAGPERRRYQSW